jgi:hypothetical protein
MEKANYDDDISPTSKLTQNITNGIVTYLQKFLKYGNVQSVLRYVCVHLGSLPARGKTLVNTKISLRQYGEFHNAT